MGIVIPILADKEMLLAEAETGSLIGILFEQMAHEGLGEAGDIGGVEDMPVPLSTAVGASFSPLVNLVSQGSYPCEQLKGQHSQTPQIHLARVFALVFHLGRYVIECAAEGRPEGSAVEFASPAEVAQLGSILDGGRSTSKAMTMFSGLMSLWTICLSWM